ncbi:hypothetical protein MRX96_027868 [Rhipicephalus microplus]
MSKMSECNHSYARAAGQRSEPKQSELLKNEEKSEQALLPATTQPQTTTDDTLVLNKSKKLPSSFDTNAERRWEIQRLQMHLNDELTDASSACNERRVAVENYGLGNVGVPSQRLFDFSTLGFKVSYQTKHRMDAVLTRMTAPE